MSDENQACEVPLVEQLRSIPEDYRTVRAIQWSEDGSETGHQFIPVGFMMHRAAAEIERLRAAAPEGEAQEARRYRAWRDGEVVVRGAPGTGWEARHRSGQHWDAGSWHWSESLDEAMDTALVDCI